MAEKRYKGYKQAMRSFSAAEDKIIKSLRKGGATGEEIARELGCHKGAVHRRLREMGLTYHGFWKTIRAKEEKAPKKPAKKAAPQKPAATKKPAAPQKPAASKKPTAVKKPGAPKKPTASKKPAASKG
jgi:deoxyribodipyrimidine photolyase